MRKYLLVIMALGLPTAAYAGPKPYTYTADAGATATDAGIAPDLVCVIHRARPWLYRCAARPSAPPAQPFTRPTAARG